MIWAVFEYFKKRHQKVNAISLIDNILSIFFVQYLSQFLKPILNTLPVRAKALKNQAIKKALPLQAYYWLYPGRCPGLGAFALSIGVLGNFNCTGRVFPKIPKFFPKFPIFFLNFPRFSPRFPRFFPRFPRFFPALGKMRGFLRKIRINFYFLYFLTLFFFFS